MIALGREAQIGKSSSEMFWPIISQGMERKMQFYHARLGKREMRPLILAMWCLVGSSLLLAQSSVKGREILDRWAGAKNRPQMDGVRVGLFGSAGVTGAEACDAVRRRVEAGAEGVPADRGDVRDKVSSGLASGWQAWRVCSVCFLLAGSFPRSSPGCGHDGSAGPAGRR